MINLGREQKLWQSLITLWRSFSDNRQHWGSPSFWIPLCWKDIPWISATWQGWQSLKCSQRFRAPLLLGLFITFPVPVSGSASGCYSAVAFPALATRCLSLALQISFPCFSDLFLLCLRSLKSLRGNFVSGGFGVQTWVMCDNSSSCQPQQDDSSIAGNTNYFKKQLGKRTSCFFWRYWLCPGCFTR